VSSLLIAQAADSRIGAAKLADRARKHGPSEAIPQLALVAAGPFGALSATQVIAALQRGLREAGNEHVEECPLQDTQQERGPALTALLLALDFDTRLRKARALVVAESRLERGTLERSAAFELATRARQAGVPCYGVTARNGLNAFDARMLDLQRILEASDSRGLAAAGRALARVL
jgi:glycerate kinase